jgi:AraC family transcriptional regulator
MAIDAGYRSSARPSHHSACAGEVIYNPPGIVHRDHFDEVGSRFLAISIPAQVALDCRNAFVIQSAEGRTILERMIGLCLTSSESSLIAAEDQILSLLGLVAGDRTTMMARPRWLARALEAMEDMVPEARASISQIANLAGVHPVHFARVHRAVFGFGPAEALRRRRASWAVAMLDGHEPLASIATSCGFADQSHMCRELSARFGITPARLRQRLAR